MATVNGTVSGVHMLGGSNNADGTSRRLAYLLNLTFPQYTSGDTATVTGVPTAIGTFTRNGKTFTVRGALGYMPGRNAAGVTVYSSPTITNSSGTLTFSLCSSVTGLDASTLAVQGVQIIVTGDEA